MFLFTSTFRSDLQIVFAGRYKELYFYNRIVGAESAKHRCGGAVETIKKYSRAELDIFCKLFGELLIIYEKNISAGDWCDPLGEYYEC
jgi:hypothetical protein